MKTDAVKQREREKEMLSLMIRLYCRARHKAGSGLCPDCAALDAYARQRSELCPFAQSKTFCSNCSVHCYTPDMRERIRAVMRFSGPRMLLRRPVTAIRHGIAAAAERRRMGKKQ